MKPASELEEIAGAPAKNTRQTFAFALFTACPTFAFAFWTVTTHFAVAAHLSFASLSRVGPFVLLAGIVCGVFAARGRESGASPQPLTSMPLPSWKWPGIAAALVLLRALGMGYSAFWIGIVLFLIAAMARLGRTNSPSESPAPLTSRRALAIFLLAFASAAVTYAAHRPNIDDAIYVGTATDAVAHPDLPVLSHDVLYGGDNLPLMLPSYAVETYELLIALFARLFGGEPIFWAHAIVPTLVALILPFAWGSLMRTLVPRRWVAATAVALFVLSLPGVSIGLGNFAFVTLFYGKAILVSAGIPLLYAFAWKFQETGSIWDEGERRRAVLTFVPVGYPLACGLAVRGGFKALEPIFAHLPVRAHLAVSLVFTEHAQYLFLFGLLASPFLVRGRPLGWKLTVIALVYFLGPLNPFTLFGPAVRFRLSVAVLKLRSFERRELFLGAAESPGARLGDCAHRNCCDTARCRAARP